MRNLHLPNLLGYRNLKSNKHSINSEFFSYINELSIENYKGRFPQRVPRSGFFQEIALCEPEFTNEYTQIIESLRDSFSNSKDEHTRLNYLNCLLRRGDFEFILKLNENFQKSKFQFDYRLIQIMAKYSIELSNNLEISDRLIIKLGEDVYQSHEDEIYKIEILNRLVVSLCRYQKYKKHQQLVHNYCEYIISKLDLLDESVFEQRLQKSIIYRGISMAYQCPEVDTDKFLKLSLEHAKAILGQQDKLEDNIARENIYTLYLTLYKYEKMKGNIDNAKEFYQKMDETDPNDSTHLTEMGMYYINQEDADNALIYLKHAIKLGPPAMSMNYFFQGLCYQELGNNEEFVNSMLASSEFDSLAVSPLFELYSFYKSLKDPKALEFKEKIINNKDLYDQLDEEELEVINEN